MEADNNPTPDAGHSDRPRSESRGTTYVRVEDVRPDGYDGTCLRPLGLCELGGSCDACWYRPDHPRFRGQNS